MRNINRRVTNGKEHIMSVEINTSGEIATINLSGNFDFSHQDSLQQAFEQAMQSTPQQINIDFEAVTFIDSTIIRLLLKLHDTAHHKQSTLTIMNCNEHIREIFVIGGFDKIFKIN